MRTTDYYHFQEKHHTLTLKRGKTHFKKGIFNLKMKSLLALNPRRNACTCHRTFTVIMNREIEFLLHQNKMQSIEPKMKI